VPLFYCEVCEEDDKKVINVEMERSGKYLLGWIEENDAIS
jgi:hypothetical protein